MISIPHRPQVKKVKGDNLRGTIIAFVLVVVSFLLGMAFHALLFETPYHTAPLKADSLTISTYRAPATAGRRLHPANGAADRN